MSPPGAPFTHSDATRAAPTGSRPWWRSCLSVSRGASVLGSRQGHGTITLGYGTTTLVVNLSPRARGARGVGRGAAGRHLGTRGACTGGGLEGVQRSRDARGRQRPGGRVPGCAAAPLDGSRSPKGRPLLQRAEPEFNVAALNQGALSTGQLREAVAGPHVHRQSGERAEHERQEAAQSVRRAEVQVAHGVGERSASRERAVCLRDATSPGLGTMTLTGLRALVVPPAQRPAGRWRRPARLTVYSCRGAGCHGLASSSSASSG